MNRQYRDLEATLWGKTKQALRVARWWLHLVFSPERKQWEILRIALMKIAVPLIDPDVKRLVRKGIFYHKIISAVMINVPGPYHERLARGFEVKLGVRATAEVQLYFDVGMSPNALRIYEYNAIRFVIPVQVGNSQRAAQ